MTDLEFANSKRAVENREKFRKLVVKSSVVPNDPRGYPLTVNIYFHNPVRS